MSGLPRQVFIWLQSQNLSSYVKNYKRDFANGFLIAEIFSRVYPDDIQMHSFSRGVSTQSRIANWEHLLRLFRKRRVPVSEELCLATRDYKPRATEQLLCQIYELLTEEQVHSIPVQRRGSDALPMFARSTVSKKVRDALKEAGYQDRVKQKHTSTHVVRQQRGLAARQRQSRHDPSPFSPQGLASQARHRRHGPASSPAGSGEGEGEQKQAASSNDVTVSVSPGQRRAALPWTANASSGQMGVVASAVDNAGPATSVVFQKVSVRPVQGSVAKLREAHDQRSRQASAGLQFQHQASSGLASSTVNGTVGRLGRVNKSSLQLMSAVVLSTLREGGGGAWSGLLRRLDPRVPAICCFVDCVCGDLLERQLDRDLAEQQPTRQLEAAAAVFQAVHDKLLVHLAGNALVSPSEYWAVARVSWQLGALLPPMAPAFVAVQRLLCALGRQVASENGWLAPALLNDFLLSPLLKAVVLDSDKDAAVADVIAAHLTGCVVSQPTTDQSGENEEASGPLGGQGLRLVRTCAGELAVYDTRRRPQQESNTEDETKFGPVNTRVPWLRLLERLVVTQSQLVPAGQPSAQPVNIFLGNRALCHMYLHHVRDSCINALVCAPEDAGSCGAALRVCAQLVASEGGQGDGVVYRTAVCVLQQIMATAQQRDQAEEMLVAGLVEGPVAVLVGFTRLLSALLSAGVRHLLSLLNDEESSLGSEQKASYLQALSWVHSLWLVLVDRCGQPGEEFEDVAFAVLCHSMHLFSLGEGLAARQLASTVAHDTADPDRGPSGPSLLLEVIRSLHTRVKALLFRSAGRVHELLMSGGQVPGADTVINHQQLGFGWHADHVVQVVVSAYEARVRAARNAVPPSSDESLGTADPSLLTTSELMLLSAAWYDRMVDGHAPDVTLQTVSGPAGSFARVQRALLSALVDPQLHPLAHQCVYAFLVGRGGGITPGRQAALALVRSASKGTAPPLYGVMRAAFDATNPEEESNQSGDAVVTPVQDSLLTLLRNVARVHPIGNAGLSGGSGGDGEGKEEEQDASWVQEVKQGICGLVGNYARFHAHGHMHAATLQTFLKEVTYLAGLRQ